MRLSPGPTVRVVHGCRALPLPRAWSSLVPGLHGAIPGRRPVGGYGDVSRPPRVPLSSVSAIVTSMAIAPQDVCGAALVGCTCSEKASEPMRPTVDDARPWKAEKTQNPLLGVVCLLTRCRWQTLEGSDCETDTVLVTGVSCMMDRVRRAVAARTTS
jgi:hypothetical protein